MTARRNHPERLVAFNVAELRVLERLVRDCFQTTPEPVRPLLFRIENKLERAQRQNPPRKRAKARGER